MQFATRHYLRYNGAMIHAIISFFSEFPPELATLLMAMFPLTERLVLPIALSSFHLPVWEVFVLSVAGNMVPVTIVLALAERFHQWVSKKSGIFGKAWVKSIARAQRDFARYEEWGLWGVFFFVIIPTPINGIITASIIAFILGYPMRRSFPFLFAGAVVFNLLALGATVGVGKLF